ncbi:MAG: alpha/beta fold hydrolase [Bacteroidota bacterium]
MKLHYRKLGEGKPLIVLHGVFGSSDNWQSLGKVFAEKFCVYLVDLRNHGNSPHSDEFNYDLMVADVIELLDNESIEKATLLGHSMGGKVAMHLATAYHERVDKLMVVDIAPREYPPHHQQIFDGFRAVDLQSLTSRKDADEQIAKVISNIGVRQFILKNLHRSPDGVFSWKLNVNAIENAANQVGKGLEKQVTYPGATLFVSGSKSDYIQVSDQALIKQHFPKALIKTVAGAGHWVHAEKPRELAEITFDFLAGPNDGR